MTDDVENLILERLRRIDGRLSNIEDNMADIKTRMAAIDEHGGGLSISTSGTNSRMDRFDEQIKRIERRLELTDNSDAR